MPAAPTVSEAVNSIFEYNEDYWHICAEILYKDRRNILVPTEFGIIKL